jgi:hypothetical protein
LSTKKQDHFSQGCFGSQKLSTNNFYPEDLRLLPGQILSIKKGSSLTPFKKLHERGN